MLPYLKVYNKVKLPNEFYRDYLITFGAVAKKELMDIVKGTSRKGKYYQRIKEDEDKRRYLNSELSSIRRKELNRIKLLFKKLRLKKAA